MAVCFEKSNRTLKSPSKQHSRDEDKLDKILGLIRDTQVDQKDLKRDQKEIKIEIQEAKETQKTLLKEILNLKEEAKT
ncbi:hypothetical protein ILUMI_15244 [Ignelater luminosus]|uniref:Uncharacterized protein n=1 Tax=Ignelater luminosus TaxID=2038154 RepID=A0A8K0CQV5_IGNLU|nr:hypothetical protein ILUMI_15244 [Ignelater luminosus]